METITLRPYQTQGVTFLEQAQRAILADEPGLGKTLQTIMALEKLQGNNGGTLIVAPKMALGVWEDEIRKWTGKSSIIYDGSPKQRAKLWMSFQEESDIQFLITNYAKLKELYELRRTWNSIVCDEIHSGGLLNHKTQAYENLRKLNSTNLFLLTGTPIKRGPQDLFAPLSLVNSKAFKSYWGYVNKYCVVINDTFGKSIEGRPKDPALFKQMLKPYFLHRKKKDHLEELPDKIRQPIPINMTKKQAKLYDQMNTEMMIDDDGKLILSPSAMTQSLRLRQLLVTPRLLDIDEDGAALEALPELLDEEFQAGNPCVIFTPFRQAIPHIVNKLDDNFAKTKKPAVNQINIVQGGMKSHEITKAVADFQNSKDVRRVLIVVIKSGAAFTATAGKTAFFLGYEWNPNENIQAEDRLHRLGQNKAVRIHYLLHKDTIDEHVKEVLNDKDRWARLILS